MRWISGMLVQLGAADNWMFETENDGGGLLIGLNLGYIWDLLGNTWSLDDYELEAGPEAGFGGPYFRLRIGGGGQHGSSDD